MMFFLNLEGILRYIVILCNIIFKMTIYSFVWLTAMINQHIPLSSPYFKSFHCLYFQTQVDFHNTTMLLCGTIRISRPIPWLLVYLFIFDKFHDYWFIDLCLPDCGHLGCLCISHLSLFFLCIHIYTIYTWFFNTKIVFSSTNKTYASLVINTRGYNMLLHEAFRLI